MSILIMGTFKDAHAHHIYRVLKDRQHEAYLLDTGAFPTQLSLSWQPHQQAGTLLLADGTTLSTSEIQSVYWRSFRTARLPKIHDAYQHKLAERDCDTMLRTILQLPHIKWVNGWDAYQFHREKPLQLHCVHQLGIKIPETLVGNDALSIQTFAKSHEKVIFKPLYGGAHTQFLTPEHLDPQHLNRALRMSPVTLQTFIDGTNIRVYVIGKDIFALEIRSSTMDFRDDRDHQLIPIQLPQDIQDQSRAIAQALYLKWTAIDWRRKPDGTYVFLEANPSPMFLKVEKESQYPITEALIRLLTTPSL